VTGLPGKFIEKKGEIKMGEKVKKARAIVALKYWGQQIEEAKGKIERAKERIKIAERQKREISRILGYLEEKGE